MTSRFLGEQLPRLARVALLVFKLVEDVRSRICQNTGFVSFGFAFHAVLLIVEVWSMINAIQRRRVLMSNAFHLKFLVILAFPPTSALLFEKSRLWFNREKKMPIHIGV